MSANKIFDAEVRNKNVPYYGKFLFLSCIFMRIFSLRKGPRTCSKFMINDVKVILHETL